MTETKAMYYAVAPEQEPTYPELVALKAAYLKMGREHFEALALVISAFGHPVKLDQKRQQQTYLVWQRDSITALYYDVTGNYLADAERYQTTEVLSIFVDCPDIKHLLDADRTQVCYLQRGDAEVESEQRFIPGRWLEVMMAELPAAYKVVADEQAKVNEAIRVKLARELMIGIEV